MGENNPEKSFQLLDITSCKGSACEFNANNEAHKPIKCLFGVLSNKLPFPAYVKSLV